MSDNANTHGLPLCAAGFRRQLDVISQPSHKRPIVKIVYIPNAPEFTIRHILKAIETSGISRGQIALFILATPVYFFAADIFHKRASGVMGVPQPAAGRYLTGNLIRRVSSRYACIGRIVILGSSKFPDPANGGSIEENLDHLKLDDNEPRLDPDGEPAPRTDEEYAQTTLTLRDIMSSKEAGVIIGKGGQNVANLRDETGSGSRRGSEGVSEIL